MSRQIRQFYDFGAVRLDASNRLLYKDGKQLSLQPKLVETLLVLITNAPALVDKETLLSAVWQDAIVEEGGLKRNISLLRKALGDEGRFIETLPKRGYRFAGEVKESWEKDATAPITPSAHTEIILERRANLTIKREEEASDSPEPHPLILRGLLSQKSWRYLLILVAIPTVLLLSVFSFWALKKSRVDSNRASIKSIAVLPFRNLAAKGKEEHLGVGMADVLITRLSNIRTVNVRPTSAVMMFNNSEQDSITAGQKLGVDAVLEGTIYTLGDRMRVTARLLKVNDQFPIWAAQFDERADDFLLVQNGIAQQVASFLEVSSSDTREAALRKRYTESADAYQLYLTGRYHLNKRDGDIKAESYFRQAIEKDSKFALAYLGLADILTMKGLYEQSALAIGKALEIDDQLGEAYASRGFWRMFKAWQWDKAEADFQRSIELSPGYGTAHQWYAALLAITGRVEEAKAEMQRALEIDPISHNFLADMAQMHYFAREYDEAESYCRKSLEIFPNFSFAREYLKDVRFKKGEGDKAIELELNELKANFPAPVYPDEVNAQELALAEAYRLFGYKGYLRALIKRYSNRTADAFGYYALSRYYAVLGENENALDCLEKGCESREFMLPFVNVDPIYDDLRSEARFQAVIRTMGLQPM
jgi:DNA-binding winged helix-turn-helix (wHTH) protein/TolB-like protein